MATEIQDTRGYRSVKLTVSTSGYLLRQAHEYSMILKTDPYH
jgi:hypothetical protein